MSELIFNCRFVVDDERDRGSLQDRLNEIKEWINRQSPVSNHGLTYMSERLATELDTVSGHWEVQTEEEGS